MHIPTKLKIQGKTWTVQLVPGMRRKENLCGECDLRARKIRIAADQSVRAQGITLLHEALHAMWPKKVTGNSKEELVIEHLDSLLYDFLKLNKFL